MGVPVVQFPGVGEAGCETRRTADSGEFPARCRRCEQVKAISVLFRPNANTVCQRLGRVARIAWYRSTDQRNPGSFLETKGAYDCMNVQWKRSFRDMDRWIHGLLWSNDRSWIVIVSLGMRSRMKITWLCVLWELWSEIFERRIFWWSVKF